MWDLIKRLSFQVRVSPGALIGWDMTAALALAQASGVPLALAAEILPEIEPVFVEKTNEQLGANNDG